MYEVGKTAQVAAEMRRPRRTRALRNPMDPVMTTAVNNRRVDIIL